MAALEEVPPPDGTGVVRYRLSDYLDQQGRRVRQTSLGPVSLWAALVIYTLANDFDVGTPVVILLCAIAGYVVASDAAIRLLRSLTVCPPRSAHAVGPQGAQPRAN